jgi:hypothetical protein
LKTFTKKSKQERALKRARAYVPGCLSTKSPRSSLLNPNLSSTAITKKSEGKKKKDMKLKRKKKKKKFNDESAAFELR